METDYQLKNPDKSRGRSYGGNDRIMSGAADAGASFSNPDIDKLVYSIGEQGQLNKTFKSVTPGETSTVSGMFASSWLRLNMFEVALAILAVIAFFVAILYASRRFTKRTNHSNTMKVEDESINLNVQNKPALLTPLYWIASFISAVLVGALTVLITYLGESGKLDFIVDGGPVVSAFIFLSGLLMYVVAILGPVIYVGIKYKWKAVIAVIVMQFVWYALAVFVVYSIIN